MHEFINIGDNKSENQYISMNFSGIATRRDNSIIVDIIIEIFILVTFRVG